MKAILLSLCLLSSCCCVSNADVWISVTKVKSLPMSGSGWSEISKAAGSVGSADMSDQNNDHDVNTLALTYVAIRSGDVSKISKAKAELIKGLNSVHGGRTLAIGRNLCSYVVAADLLRGYLSAQDNLDVSNQIKAILNKSFDQVGTLGQCHERRPNNWGTMAGGSRVAAAVYLKDTALVARCATVFRGWLGDRAKYAGFDYGDTSWQADPKNPVGINPLGATKSGKNIDGVLPDDLRRGGSFPSVGSSGTSYSWEALQGAIVQAEILRLQGYDTYSWSDGAMGRAYKWLYTAGKSSADGDDKWQPFIINAVTGSKWPEPSSGGAGKIMGWSSWTH